eukprot:gene3061-biopygen20802
MIPREGMRDLKTLELLRQSLQAVTAPIEASNAKVKENEVPFAGFFSHVVEQRLLGPGSQTPLPRMSPASAQAMYQTSLGTAASVIDHSVAKSTLHRRYVVGEEFTTWLSQLPDSYPHSMLYARPEDLLCFMDCFWLERHGGSILPGCSTLVPSPQGVDSAFSHLSTLFEQLGRGGEYDPRSNTGNPCHSGPVRNYKKGYQKLLFEAGYQEVSAVPMVISKVHALVAYLDVEARRASDPVKRISFLRDAVSILHAWETAYRGTEGGKLCLPDLHTPNRVQLYPNGYDPSVPMPEVLLSLPTHGTKTKKKGRVYQAPVYIKLHPQPAVCLLSHLWAFQQMCYLSGFPIRHYILRPSTYTQKGFREAPYSGCLFTKMVQKHLKAIQLFNHETAHSFRRGALQAAAQAAGPSQSAQLAAAAAAGRIQTPAVVQLYLHPERHLARLGRE